MFLRVDVEHSVPHVHTQNGLARTLVMCTKLLVFAWDYTILHAAILVRLRPTATQPYYALQLVIGYELDASYLHVYECAVYVPIAPPQRTIGFSIKGLSIYVDYASSSIIRFLKPLTGDLFTAKICWLSL